MENIFYYNGKAYYIPKEEQKEFTFDFGLQCFREGEPSFYVESEHFYKMPVKVVFVDLKDKYYAAKTIEEKVDALLQENIIIETCEAKNRFRVVIFNWGVTLYTIKEKAEDFAEQAKKVVKKMIMPDSEADWQNFSYNLEMKNGMIKYFDMYFEKVKNDNIAEDEDKIVDMNSSMRKKLNFKSKDKYESSDNSNNLERLTRAESEKWLLENQEHLDKEKRRFVFLNSKLHLLASLGIDEHFFEDLDLDLQRQILHLHITYGCELFKFFIMVTSNNNISLEKKLEFVVKVLNEYNSKNENAKKIYKENNVIFSVVQSIIYQEIKNDPEILKQTVNKLVSDYLGIGYCGFIQESESNIFDFFATSSVKLHLANEFFRKLNPRIQMEFMKNFNEEKYRQLKILNNDYLKFLVENELFQNYLINNPDEFFVLPQFCDRAKSYGAFLESLSAIINDYSVNFEYRMRFAEKIFEKFKSCEGKLKEKNMSLLEIICNKIESGSEILNLIINRLVSYKRLIELHDNFSENPQITRNEIFAKLSLPLKRIYLKTSQKQRVIFDTLDIGFLNLINAHKVLQTYLITYPDKLSVLSNFYESTHSNAIKALELFNIVMDSDNIYFYERIDFLEKVLSGFQSEDNSPQINVRKIICDKIENNQEILELTVCRFVDDNLGIAAFNFVRELKAENLKNILYWFTTIDTTFYKLNSNLKFVFLKNFVEGNQDVFSVLMNNNEFLNLLIANEKLQNFSMLYPNEINTLIEIYQSTPHFLKLEPLSRAVMFFKACEGFSWKDDIRKKFCSVIDDRLLQDKNLISFLDKCQNEKQMKVVCEIYHYGGNKINGKFGINEINHFEVICKMLEEFSPNDETYNSYRMRLAKLYVNAEKIGLFKNKCWCVDGVLKFRVDEIFLLEVPRYPDIVDKLISGELSFDDAIDNVLSNDFLLFYWIGHANLKFSNLPLIRNLFLSFRDIFASMSENECYNVINNIYELKKFVCNLSDNFNLSSENFVEFVEKLREVIKIPGALSKLNVKGNNIETVQSAIEILNNDLDTQETSNDLETRVNLINYYNDQIVNDTYWCSAYLFSAINTIFDLNSKNIKEELDKNLITAQGTLSECIKISNDYANSIFLKFFAQKAIYDSENLEIRLENLTFLFDQRVKLLKNDIRLNYDQNIQEQIDPLKKYFTHDFSDLDLDYINSVSSMDDIKNDLIDILNKLSGYKSNCSDSDVKNKIGSLCKVIKEYLYPCILLHKVLIPKAKMMIEERKNAKINALNLTDIPQILNKKIDSLSERERKYIFNKLMDLNEINMMRIKDILVENPDNIILVIKLFYIIEVTKNKMIEKKDRVNISSLENSEPDEKLNNEQRIFIKTDINNMFGLFKYETFSFLKSNPNIAEFMLGLNCINVDLLNIDILKRIKQLQEFCPVHFLTVYIRAVFNAVDCVVEQDKQKEMLRLLNTNYARFVANKKVFSVLDQKSNLGIVMFGLPDKADIIFKIMQDNKAIDLLKKIYFYTNDVHSIRDRLDKLFNIYKLYPEMIKENMTVKELWAINSDELKYKKEYEEILEKSTQVKWYQTPKTLEQKREAILKEANSIINDIATLKVCTKEKDNRFKALNTATGSVIVQETKKENNYLIEKFKKQCQEDFNMSVLQKWYQRTRTREQNRQAIASKTDLFVQKINNMSNVFVKMQCLKVLINTKDSIVMQEAEKMRREFESSNRAEDQSR